MSNDTCAISSINDLLSQANANQLNITTTVSQCPDICALAWGNGNPDLSGIGANISYIFQAILSILCGPLLCLVYELRHRWRLGERTAKHLSALHDSFLDISAQFSIPVAIAAVIRLRQKAPFYELAFLRSLTTMQFLGLLSTAVTVGLFEDDYERGVQRITIIVLYGLIEFGFYMGLIGGLVTNPSTWERINELTDACKAYGHIFPWLKHIPPPVKVNLPHISVKDYFNPVKFSAKKWKFAFIIIGFIIAGFLALILACVMIYFLAIAFWKILTGERDGGWRYLVLPMSAAFTIAMLVELVEMERTRNFMKVVAGADFQDNQWGFGQVIALFLWMPLCTQLFYYLTRLELQPKRATRSPSPADSLPTVKFENEKAQTKDIEVGDSAGGMAKDSVGVAVPSRLFQK
ncbi:hypothetical protein CPB83DRAFT_849898 [Crepidotus variabilis]|uniref:Uncharacterized protein n=1 Tax=Crepidotus variabilis TaxID=179855 RepID=A0A9P6ELA0_9AGAR|nr:hypothetical protein CPB83DRAFT_849898 [Crepidotus variabilis]